MPELEEEKKSIELVMQVRQCCKHALHELHNTCSPIRHLNARSHYNLNAESDTTW